MTIHEFIDREKRRLAKFQSDWMELAATKPSNFPLEMDEGDWLEQYAMADVNIEEQPTKG